MGLCTCNNIRDLGLCERVECGSSARYVFGEEILGILGDNLTEVDIRRETAVCGRITENGDFTRKDLLADSAYFEDCSYRTCFHNPVSVPLTSR